MTRDKDRKRIIRARMRKTGESCTAARAHVVSTRSKAKPSAAEPDYATLAGMKDEAIAARTGRTWKQWTRVLDADGAATMPHRAIAELVHGRHGVGDWWAQTVTVGYERIKGLRDRGQRRGGAYEASKSRTFNVPVPVLFDAWTNASARHLWLEQSDAVLRSATPPKRLRLGWSDGTTVTAEFTAKGATKSAVAVTHLKLPGKSAVDDAKKRWTARLDALATVLAESVAAV